MASSLTQPTLITTPFANSGSKRTIPIPSQIGVTDGQASFTDGFPPLNATPLASGGVPPSILDMNGALNAITQNLRYLLGGGTPKFNATMAATIGGYPVGAILIDNAGQNLYINILDGNSTDFNTTPASIGVSWMPALGLDFLNNRVGHTYTSSDWAYIDKGRGLIVQWTSSASIATNSSGSVTWPVTFNNSCIFALTAPYGASTNVNAGNVVIGASTVSGATLYNWGPISAIARCIALGF